MKDFLKNRVAFYSSMYKGRSSCFEIAECAVEKGVGGLELMNFCDELKRPDMAVAKEIGAYARKNGLQLPCFSCGINFLTDDTVEKVERMKGYVDICEALEIPYFHHTIALWLNRESINMPIEDVVRIGTECALEINEYAAARGVKSIIEDQGFVFNGVENYGRLMKAANGKLGTVLDVGNINFVDELAEDFCAAFIDNICHVHIKDYKITDEPIGAVQFRSAGGKYITSCEFGLGDINLPAVAKQLADHGYNGFYALEFDGTSDDGEVDRVLERMYNIFREV